MQDYEQPSLLQVHATEILLIIAINLCIMGVIMSGFAASESIPGAPLIFALAAVGMLVPIFYMVLRLHIAKSDQLPVFVIGIKMHSSGLNIQGLPRRQ